MTSHMEDAKCLTLEQYLKAWINLSQGKVIEVKSPHASVIIYWGE